MTPITRRDWLKGTAAVVSSSALGSKSIIASGSTKFARIAITLDLEMSRNFPMWENTHWDYEKGNLDEATKRYA
ncbi:MAG: hypothetical protein ACKOOI_05015, partial [Pirellula sp.]